MRSLLSALRRILLGPRLELLSQLSPAEIFALVQMSRSLGDVETTATGNGSTGGAPGAIMTTGAATASVDKVALESLNERVAVLVLENAQLKERVDALERALKMRPGG